MNSNSMPSEPERRTFFKKAGTFILGAIMMLVPLASGLAVFFDPLRKKSRAGEE